MSQISELFDKALQLPEGKRITLTLTSDKDVKSKVVMLIRERTAYEESVKGNILRKKVFIQQEVSKKQGIFKIHVSVTPPSFDWMKTAVIVDEDEGTAQPLFEEETVDKEELARIERLKQQQQEV